MPELPETHESLLLKLRDPDDAAAWREFVSTYRPTVYRLARRAGLQDADSEDLSQRVMASVARAVGDWRKDADRGTFRGWLLRIARNEIVNALTRGRRHVGRGGTSVLVVLGQHPDDEDALGALIEDEHRRAVFQQAAAAIQGEIHESSWRAFVLTTVEGLSPEQATVRTGLSLGAVYAARSRVMRRLREKVQELTAED